MDTSPTQASPRAAGRRQIELARRTCVIRPDRIAIRPSPGALVPPLIGLIAGFLSAGLIMGDVMLWRGALPFPLMTILLIVALFCLPLSGMGLVYAAFGSNVVIDRAKQSATWQQGVLGLGVGTTELVPFWKIEAIAVDESGEAIGRLTEEFVQWEIVLIKKSGSRLTIGRVSTLRSLTEQSLARALEVARAIADLTGAPLQEPRPLSAPDESQA